MGGVSSGSVREVMSRGITKAQIHTSLNADSCEFYSGGSDKSVLAVGTYQLNESDNRKGNLLLYNVEGITHPSERSTLSELQNLDIAGIFDLKWSPHMLDRRAVLGAACADGIVNLFTLQHEPNTNLTYMASTAPFKNNNSNVEGIPMCLSLDWDNKKTSSPTPHIGVSYSSGALGIWECGDNDIRLLREWQAHSYEAWAVSFNIWQPTTLWSGADDCYLKGWDLREGISRATFTKKQDMGITCIQFAPHQEFLVAVGCYNESIQLWDTRAMKSPLSGAQTSGGGVWRVKWGEYDGKNLVCGACMHAGFQLWQCTDDFMLHHIESYTTPHTSLAYGIDYYYGTTSPVIACCSFYDKLLSLWQPSL